MIGNQHKVPCPEGSVDSTGSVRKKQNLSSHHLHQTGRQNHIRYRVSLIVMNPSLHTYYRNALHVTENKFTGMSWYGRNRKALDFFIINFSLYLHRICIIAKTGAKHQCNLGRKRDPVLNTFIAFCYLFIYLIHCIPSLFQLITFHNCFSIDCV